MVDALDIGYAIKDRRLQLGLTQAQVADEAKVSKRCLWSLELGQNPGVQFNKLTAVLEALGLELTIEAGDGPKIIAHDDQNMDSAGITRLSDNPCQEQQANKAFDALAILTEGRK
ncbi:MAG: helix-turn-helix domain-containing protein [Slackia sp.]|nr:helix-turn-helix domain-containing protein [Slackia sp.]